MQADKRRLILVLVSAGVVLAPLMAYRFWPREPSYQGKLLSAWIEPFCKQTPTGIFAPAGPQYFEQLQPVRQAVVQIGTNGLPLLIACVEHRESKFKRTLREWLAKQPISALKPMDPRCSQIRAIRALAVLGPTARPAIPALAAQLSDSTLADHVIYALSGMGPEGMRVLVKQFTNAGPSVRMQIANVLIVPSSTYRGENASRLELNQIPNDIMVEGLSRVILDPTKFFQVSAAHRLGDIGPAASNAVPVLLKLLDERNPMTRHVAVQALSRIGTPPEVVIPALTNLLSDPDLSTRMAATFALRKLDSITGSAFEGGPINQPTIVPRSTNSFR